jgi:hypothetical protein
VAVIYLLGFLPRVGNRVGDHQGRSAWSIQLLIVVLFHNLYVKAKSEGFRCRAAELNQQIESYKMRVGAIIKSQLDILNDIHPEAGVVSEAALTIADDSDSDVKTYYFDE